MWKNTTRQALDHAILEFDRDQNGWRYGLMAIFGAPHELPEPALAAARAGLNMIEMIELLNTKRIAASNRAYRHWDRDR